MIVTTISTSDRQSPMIAQTFPALALESIFSPPFILYCFERYSPNMDVMIPISGIHPNTKDKIPNTNAPCACFSIRSSLFISAFSWLVSCTPTVIYQKTADHTFDNSIIISVTVCIFKSVLPSFALTLFYQHIKWLLPKIWSCCKQTYWYLQSIL